MKLLFDKARWMMDSESTWLMLKVNARDATDFVDEMKDGKVYEADLKEHRKKRSLDANAYAWTLLGKLANKVGLPKEEVYREIIKDVGGNYEILPIRNDAVDKWISNWSSKGIGWVCDILLQMSRLINLIQEECKHQGIEVLTPAELALLMDGWAS